MKKILLIIIFGLSFVISAHAADPTATMRTIQRNTPTTAIDTATERLSSISNETAVSTGDGNELDLLEVDITDGSANSDVFYVLWHISADGGNSTGTGFKVWASSVGFNRTGSVIKFKQISGADQASPSTTENYVADATISSYTWLTMPESEPASQNLWPSDEGDSMALSTTSDDVLMFAIYISLDGEEVPGTYSGTTSGFELQLSIKGAYN